LREHFDANKRHWDELVPIHMRSEYYDVAGFRDGKTHLNRLELEELGDVRGKSLLHLQCHFGLDTLSWAHEGAVVTGVDFSEPAIQQARALAADTGIEARFIASNIYDLPHALDERFDIVFTSYGVLSWLPDVNRWAEIVAHFLKPGGTFYMVEFHPVSGIFDSSAEVDLQVIGPYFTPAEPLVFEDDGSYADRDAKLLNRRTNSWPHPISDVVTSLIEAGLRIEFLHEFPFTIEQWFPFMEAAAEGHWRLTKNDGCVPLLYSIKATKVA
jgi:SAM-dependent methyltransferase